MIKKYSKEGFMIKKIYLASPISKYVRNGMNKDYTETMDNVYNLLCSFGETYYPLKKKHMEKIKQQVQVMYVQK